ncbi:MAG: SGNH/GDSL hydrolase family protein [Bdellovibrionaceae bacterium]|nr:SGNH/GDSL hydrolase family protein [Pseudobdellovibrionaceae bacterium]
MTLINDVTHVPKPYVMFTAKPFAQKYNLPGNKYAINSLGYLSPIPNRTKAPSTYRIFVLGGSVVFNGQPSFSFLLQDVFTSRGESNVEVYNYGVVSSVSRQELVRTLLEISTYKPDLIISFSGYNDVFNTGWDKRVNYPHRYILFENNPLLKMRAADFPFMLNILLSSEILRKLFEEKISKSVVDLHDRMPINWDLRQQMVARAYVQNLRLTNVLAQDFGAQFVAFFQPTVYFKKPLSPAETEIVKMYRNEPATDIRKSVFNEYFNYKSEFRLVDSSEIFNGQTAQVFKDPVHYAEESTNFLAGYFQLFVGRLLIQRKKINFIFFLNRFL